MNLEDNIQKFIQNPLPLWETGLTQELVSNKWEQLTQCGLTTKDSYTTAKIWLNNPLLQSDKKILPTKSTGETIYVEPSSVVLNSFYEEHGLEVLTEKELESSSVLNKLQRAFEILQQIEPVYSCVMSLVRAIHVLRNDNAEIDLSYSHPKIPFSIFVSVCEDSSEISNLRVAESILHEAMHLKLTLIEDIIPLIKVCTSTLYYSPWKNEARPAQGILHGLFVFRAIYEFYTQLNRNNTIDSYDFFKLRKEEIANEITSLKNFSSFIGLAEYGASLATNLLPLN